MRQMVICWLICYRSPFAHLHPGKTQLTEDHTNSAAATLNRGGFLQPFVCHVWFLCRLFTQIICAFNKEHVGPWIKPLRNAKSLALGLILKPILFQWLFCCVIFIYFFKILARFNFYSCKFYKWHVIIYSLFTYFVVFSYLFQ